jgi:flagellar basal-body rod modification protein FlgD
MATSPTALTGTEARDQYLKLMITQLQNQNPLEPTSQEDFLMQLSQFSILEGVDNLNLSFGQMLKVQELSQGAQLVGQTVQYKTDNGTARGIVQAAGIVDGALKLGIDGNEVSLDDVIAVVQPTSSG